jgi:hypothetical protein
VQSLKTELTRVIYNAATQAFEARVTVHGADGPQSYACAIEAPITLSFEDAATGLTRQALRKHGAPRGLRSWIAPANVERVATRTAQRLRRGLPLGQYGFFRGRAA